jgi:aerobic-type carbon monoxide dehydrogenase small subunit (CoxS/CutS family)
MPALNINGKTVNADVPADTPLLWMLRDVLGMTGTKFGCDIALCGACTVHLDGAPTRSCIAALIQPQVSGCVERAPWKSNSVSRTTLWKETK